MSKYYNELQKLTEDFVNEFLNEIGINSKRNNLINENNVDLLINEFVKTMFYLVGFFKIWRY